MKVTQPPANVKRFPVKVTSKSVNETSKPKPKRSPPNRSAAYDILPAFARDVQTDDLPEVNLYSLLISAGKTDEREEQFNYKPDREEKPISITVNHFPGYLRIAMDTICAEASQHVGKPSFNDAVATSIACAINWFFKDADMCALIDTKREFALSLRNAPDIELAEMIHETIEKIPLSVPGNLTKPRRVNAVVRQPLHNKIHGAHNNLGIDKQDIVLLCCLIAVAQSKHCNPAHSDHAKQTLAHFRKRVSFALRLAELCVEEFGS